MPLPTDGYMAFDRRPSHAGQGDPSECQRSSHGPARSFGSTAGGYWSPPLLQVVDPMNVQSQEQSTREKNYLDMFGPVKIPVLQQIGLLMGLLPSPAVYRTKGILSMSHLECCSKRQASLQVSIFLMFTQSASCMDPILQAL